MSKIYAVEVYNHVSEQPNRVVVYIEAGASYEILPEIVAEAVKQQVIPDFPKFEALLVYDDKLAYAILDSYPVFQIGETILYVNGNDYEIGIIKSLGRSGSYFVNYHTGDTAASTPIDKIIRLDNAYAFNVIRKVADVKNSVPCKAREMAQHIMGVLDLRLKKDVNVAKVELEIAKYLNGDGR